MEVNITRPEPYTILLPGGVNSVFLSHGRLPGMVCIVSSRRYPGQFTDQKEAEARKKLQETGKKPQSMYMTSVCGDIKPWEFSGEWFQVFIGDTTRQPRIYTVGMIRFQKRDSQLLMEIPVEFKDEF